MRKLSRDRNGDARQQAGSSMRQPLQQRERSRASDAETGRTVAAAGDDERNELLPSGDTGDRLTALTSVQMTAIAETDESEVDELFSPDTAYSSVLSPSNTQMLSNSASDSNLNSTLTPARITNSSKNQLDVERDNVNVVLRKMLQTRPVSLLRPHSCSDAATQVMASDIMADRSTCVLPGSGIRVSARHQMDGFRRNSFDPRLMRRTSSKKLSSDSCTALNQIPQFNVGQIQGQVHATTMRAAERSLSIPYADDDAMSNRSLGNVSFRSPLSPGNALSSPSTHLSSHSSVNDLLPMTSPLHHRDEIVNRLFQSIASLVHESLVG